LNTFSAVRPTVHMFRTWRARGDWGVDNHTTDVCRISHLAVVSVAFRVASVDFLSMSLSDRYE
jgi:hypothetical protein